MSTGVEEPVQEDGPTWDQIRARISELAKEDGEWGSYPLPLEGFRLVVEKRHPLASSLNGATLGMRADQLIREAIEDDGVTVRNFWYSHEKMAMVFVCQERDGRITSAQVPINYPMERLRFQLDTLGVSASGAWSADAELRAMAKLKGLVTDHAFKCYVFIGTVVMTPFVWHVFEEIK
jgi:hypothetical protein